MASKYHHVPLSGGDRKALKKELSKSRAMTRIFAERAEEKRREGEALIREADNLPIVERADVVGWRPHRSVADNRSGHQRRLHLANLADPVFVAKPQAADYNVIGSA
jgi:hypothetical protein